MNIHVIASIRKEANADPCTGAYSFYPSLTLFSVDGAEYGIPTYFSGFDELAQVLESEARVNHELLVDVFDRYDRGEEARFPMIVGDGQIANVLFSPNRTVVTSSRFADLKLF